MTEYIVLGEKHIGPEVVGGKEYKYTQHYEGVFGGKSLQFSDRGSESGKIMTESGYDMRKS